jgi:hypothetical protein
MVLTRRIDWYALDTTGPKRAGAAGWRRGGDAAAGATPTAYPV